MIVTMINTTWYVFSLLSQYGLGITREQVGIVRSSQFSFLTFLDLDLLADTFDAGFDALCLPFIFLLFLEGVYVGYQVFVSCVSLIVIKVCGIV